MKNQAPSTYVNMSAYVALSCLIAFVIVITACLVKQFIWDLLLSRRFEDLRPVLSESMRKFSTSFHRPQSITASSVSLTKSTSDPCVKPADVRQSIKISSRFLKIYLRQTLKLTKRFLVVPTVHHHWIRLFILISALKTEQMNEHRRHILFYTSVVNITHQHSVFD